MSAAAPAVDDVRCRRCGGPSVHRHDVTDRNRAVSAERFHYLRCTACDVVWLPEPPSDIGRYYPPDYHDFLSLAELPAAADGEAARLGLVLERVQSGRLVEIGPSQGVFAYAAKTAGFTVTGLEMDTDCCRNLTEVVGVEAVQTNAPAEALAGLPPSNAIVMWHVIEHVPDPWALVAAVAANLEPGGVFALATPNPGSLQYRVFGDRWVHLDAPRHVTLIPLEALTDEAARHDLTLVEATDADPVGLDCDAMGWERSVTTAPALREGPRLVHTVGRVLTTLAKPIERRGLRGSTYTAVFQKQS